MLNSLLNYSSAVDHELALLGRRLAPDFFRFPSPPLLEASTSYFEREAVGQDTTKSLLKTISAKLVERMDRGEVIQYDPRDIKPAEVNKSIQPTPSPKKEPGMDR